VNPTILDILGDVEKEGEYRSNLETSAGLADQRHMMDQAEASRYAGDIAKMKGDAAKKNSLFAAIGSMASGIGGMVKGGGGGGSSGYTSTRYG
jgi:hypothetical protein